MTASAKVSFILQQIAALDAAERAELRARLEGPAVNGARAANPSTPPEEQEVDPQDQAAFSWINAHGSAYQGQWLALDGDRLLAHGVNLVEVATAARAAGVQFPLLHLVELPREHPYIRS